MYITRDMNARKVRIDGMSKTMKREKVEQCARQQKKVDSV